MSAKKKKPTATKKSAPTRKKATLAKKAPTSPKRKPPKRKPTSPSKKAKRQKSKQSLQKPGKGLRKPAKGPRKPGKGLRKPAKGPGKPGNGLGTPSQSQRKQSPKRASKRARSFSSSETATRPSAQAVPPKDSIADELSKRGAALMQAGAFTKAIELFDEALGNDSNHLFALYGAAYCLGALNEGGHSDERVDRILELADRLIARTPEGSLWPYLQAHVFPRSTLRFARNARAWWWMTRAKTDADLERALAEIDHALKLKSPTESDQALLGLWDTKVRILLALRRDEEAFVIVQRFPSNPSTKDVRETPTYRDWEAGTALVGGAGDLFSGSAGETGVEAVLRLKDAIAKHGHQTYAALIFSEPIDPVEIAMAERKLGATLPPSYVSFVTKYGCFKLVWDKPNETTPDEIGKAFPTYRGCRQLLPPAEVASETLSVREHPMADDPATTGMLRDSLLFQENYYRDNFFTFRASSASTDGEMSVHAYFHDDAYEWRVRWVSFEDHLREWVKSVLDER